MQEPLKLCAQYFEMQKLDQVSMKLQSTAMVDDNQCEVRLCCATVPIYNNIIVLYNIMVVRSMRESDIYLKRVSFLLIINMI